MLKGFKNKKSPGPDGTPTEFFKWINADNLKLTREFLNACWMLETLPNEFEIVNVLTLYKKGKVDNPANYRPISLLNTIHKLFSSILQRRLAIRLEEKHAEVPIWL